MKKIILVLFALLLTNCSQSPIQSTTPSTATTPKVVPNAVSNQAKEYQLSIPYRSLNTSKTIQTFGFGSCNDQTRPQPLWTPILNHNPDLFIMMGDNVYASTPETQPIIDQYIKQNQVTEYRKVRESIPFLATWDDHDSGLNDGGTDNPLKDEARKVFVNYWGYLKQSLPKNQKALYHSRLIGDKKHKVQVIMLDTRYDRTPLIKNPEYKYDEKVFLPKVYLPNEDKNARMLSDEQWQWLSDELKKPADLKIIVSSIQVIANDHYFEKWGNFPLERKKLLDLIEKNKLHNVIILSGDRHLSSIAKLDLNKKHTLYEITSSGLNRPSRAPEAEKDSTYTAPAFLKINYGLAQIDWVQKSVLFEIRDEQDQVQLSQKVNFK